METRYTLAYTSPLTLITKMVLSSNFTVLNTNYKLLNGAGLSSAKLCVSLRPATTFPAPRVCMHAYILHYSCLKLMGLQFKDGLDHITNQKQIFKYLSLY